VRLPQGGQDGALPTNIWVRHGTAAYSTCGSLPSNHCNITFGCSRFVYLFFSVLPRTNMSPSLTVLWTTYLRRQPADARQAALRRFEFRCFAVQPTVHGTGRAQEDKPPTTTWRTPSGGHPTHYTPPPLPRHAAPHLPCQYARGAFGQDDTASRHWVRTHSGRSHC